jgi:hypothetical protein
MRYWKKFKADHGLESQPDVTIGMVVATYQQTHALETLLRSFQAQTHRNFRIAVAHDGPWDPQHVLDLRFKFGSDDRFIFTSSEKRENVFGHNLREQERVDMAARTDLMGFCNGDVYYAPTFFEWMAAVMVKHQSGFGYCNMLHSHRLWQPMTTELKRGKIDVGCFLASSDLVLETPWTSTEFAADWFYIRELTKGLARTEIVKIDGFLYVHN